MNNRAVAELRRTIGPRSRILEIGAGQSTLWFGRRAGHVLSLEDHDDWAAYVKRRAAALGLSTIEVRTGPISTNSLLEALAFQPDIVIVDQLEAGLTRPQAVDLLTTTVSSIEVIVLDDSDRIEYQTCLDAAERRGWRIKRLVGYKARPWAATETCLLTRASDPTA